MEATEVVTLFIGLLLVLFAIGVPVSISIGLTCLAVLWVENDIFSIPYSLFALKMMHGINSFPLLAIPYFILAATIMNTGSVTTRIFDFANALVGHLRGGGGTCQCIGTHDFCRHVRNRGGGCRRAGRPGNQSHARPRVSHTLQYWNHRGVVGDRADYSPKRGFGGLRMAG